ncbi:Peroxisome chaperone and import receptor [Coemansia sp. RSA 552]|nr:Peroxisome chaperone and import receptor [Coemansia sp. RSA 552]
MTDVPPNDAELDKLLDSALDEFDESPPKPAPPKPKEANKPKDSQGAAGADLEEDFMRELTRGMEDMLKGSADSGQGAGNDDEMRSMLDNLLKQMGTLPGDLDAGLGRQEGGDSTQAPSSSTDTAAEAGAQGAEPQSFQDKIKATMDKLKESATQADAETDSGGAGGLGMMDDLLRQMDQAGDDPQLDSLVDDVIGQLMSKEVLQQPLKELDGEYPKYLETNKDKLSKEDYERYQQQHSYIKQILALFDESQDDQVSDPRIVELLQKMQDCGQPPNELLKLLAPDMELDESGEVKVPEQPNCTIA